jgi:hypothetical protein
VLRAIICHEISRPLVLVRALVDIAAPLDMEAQDAMGGFDNLISLQVKDFERIARESLNRNDLDDYLGRVAMVYCLSLLMSQVSDYEIAEIRRGNGSQAQKEMLVSAYKDAKARYAKSCEKLFNKLVQIGLESSAG